MPTTRAHTFHERLQHLGLSLISIESARHTQSLRLGTRKILLWSLMSPKTHSKRFLDLVIHALRR